MSRVTKRTVKDLINAVLSEESFAYDAAGNITAAPNIFGIFTDLVENISDTYADELPFFNGMIDYCLNSVGYDVVLQEGADRLSIDDARNRLNDAVEN